MAAHTEDRLPPFTDPRKLPPDTPVSIVATESEARRSLSAIAEAMQLPVSTYSSLREFLDFADTGGPGCLILHICDEGEGSVVMLPYADVPKRIVHLDALPTDTREMLDDPAFMLKLQRVLGRERHAGRLPFRRAEIKGLYTSLTPRERQVMDLVVKGRTAREIALKLKISPHTVEIHRSHLLLKMRADSVSDLAQMADALQQTKPRSLG